MVIVIYFVDEAQLKLCFENIIFVKIALFHNYKRSCIFKIQFRMKCIQQCITQCIQK